MPTKVSIQPLCRKMEKGELNGLQISGIVTTYVKRYLREKYGDKCCLCGWSKINVKSGVVPLVADPYRW